MKTQPRCTWGLFLIGACLGAAASAKAANSRESLRPPLLATNPAPDRLPGLSLRVDYSERRKETIPLVAAAFPNVPGFVCESWCYESDVDFLDGKTLEGGRLKLRHRVRAAPQVVIVTTVTPEPGAVEFLARMELDRGRDTDWPKELLTPNLCWQVRPSPAFRSAPDPYPEFVKRCFIFTERGRTFLHETTRRPIPVRPLDHKYNNPPWVQMYVGTWQDIPKVDTHSWADYSPDRYTTRIIGVVSRDGKYLAALANDSAVTMCQAWHDCVHNNPQWQPADAPPEQRVWRLKVYAMENDPEALRARVLRDFPTAGPPPPSRPVKPSAAQPTDSVRGGSALFHGTQPEELIFLFSSQGSASPDAASGVKRTGRRSGNASAQPPSNARFEPRVAAEHVRGLPIARQVSFCFTVNSGALDHPLVPQGRRLFPTGLLHDHGPQRDL